jgi:hypothetical protein
LDGGIDPTAGAFGDYLTETTGDDRPGADLAWLEANIGPLPAWPANALVLRRSEAEERARLAGKPGLAGQANPGMVWLCGADADGVPGYDLRSTWIHESTHQILNFRRQSALIYTAEAKWFSEGLPTLAEWMRLTDDPLFSAGDPSNLITGKVSAYYAAANLADAACGFLSDDLEADGASNVTAYEFGGYTASQLIATYGSRGGTLPGFWSEIMGFLDTTYEVRPETLQTLIGVSLGLPSFYEEWIVAGRIGTPLLAITSIVPDTSGCVDTGDCAPETAAVRITQVQVEQLSRANGCVLDFPTFAEVPYFLSCSAAAGGELAFGECAATQTELIDTQPQSTSDRITDLTLTRNAAVAAEDVWPVRLAVLANDALLPGWVPTAGYRPLQYGTFVVCSRPDDAGCGGDADGDLYGLTADCDDADPSRNPEAAPATFTPISFDDDNNCDGW